MNYIPRLVELQQQHRQDVSDRELDALVQEWSDMGYHRDE